MIYLHVFLESSLGDSSHNCISCRLPFYTCLCVFISAQGNYAKMKYSSDPRTLSAAPSSPAWGCRLHLRYVLSCNTTSMTRHESGTKCHSDFNDIHIKEIQGPVRSLYPLCPWVNLQGNQQFDMQRHAEKCMGVIKACTDVAFSQICLLIFICARVSLWT